MLLRILFKQCSVAGLCKAPAPSAAERESMPNVVVIDDRVTNRNILTRLAASVEEGVRVKSFAGPTAALDWLAVSTPDLVITDYKMPDMDGAEFIRAFRKLPHLADVPVVVVTV